MMEIRKMKISDYDEVYALWLSCPGMGLNNLDDSRDGIEKYIKRNPDNCFTAVEKGRIIGAILTGNDGRRGYISHTAVFPDYQRKGIGRKLVESALEALKKQGIHKVNLVVFSRNAAGNAFWEKMGFTTRPDLIYRNLVLTEMERFDT
ncbi:MAG: GNAT family N-acetyltransferase [Eubacterium sp.]